MRPKWRFALLHVSLIIAIVLVAIGLVYFGSFVTFLWRAARFSALPAFGPAGYGVFFDAFPWWHLVIILVAIVAFVYLLRRSTHLYRWPLAVTLGVFLFAFLCAALVTDTTRFHDRLSHRLIQGFGVPLLGPLYHGQGRLVRGLVTPGEISKISSSTWIVQLDDDTVRVEINDETRIPANWNPEVGDEIVIIGERDDGVIEAIGIMPAERLPERRPFRRIRPAPSPSPFF